MKASRFVACALLLAGFTAIAHAQQPPRPGDSARAVTLSLAEYNRLIDLASRPTPATPVAPVSAVIGSADLRVRVERETARGRFSVAGEVLRAGVSRVNLLSGATLVDANASGKPLPLIAEGNVHTALIPGPGPFTLALDWGAPVSFTPGRASFVLPVPPAGAVRATIDLPGEQADVSLSAGLITGRVVANGRTIVDATLDPGSSTEVSWSMRDSAPVAVTKDVRTLSDVMTLISLGDSDVRMVALIDVTVLQGELRSLAVRVPPGYEMTGVSGNSLDSSEQRDNTLLLTVAEPSARSQQFLVSLERPHAGGSFAMETSFVTVADVQRERGEVAIEGVGTLELEAAERQGMHRIDVRELNGALQSLAKAPLLAAFRYQRTASASPLLALDVKRFADAGVLAAVADAATATTLVTSEGRALTEVILFVQNRAQPFLRVTLPAGATMVSVKVAGETAKPVLGADGIRVPLLRPGFRPSGLYDVSFVYVHAGTPFERQGELDMTLPRMDIPIGLIEWEVFVPDRYSARAIDGNAINVRTLAQASRGRDRYDRLAGRRLDLMRSGGVRVSLTSAALPGQIRGRVTDESGGVLPGVTVHLQTVNGARTAMTGEDGTFTFSGIAAGQVTFTASLAGFNTQGTSFVFDQRPRQIDVRLGIASLTETVTVSAEAPSMDRPVAEPSANVLNLQKRTAGVLPIRVDVPRAGTSHQFVKPLVVDQETVVKLRYKRR